MGHDSLTVMNRKYIWYISIAAIVGVLIALGVLITRTYISAGDESEPVYIDQELYYPVTRVLDGDTFNVQVNEKEITIRMLGINTPETVDPRKLPECYGREASDETKLLLSNQSVKLELNPKREVRDKYGRYLAYVYREDEMLVNEYLIRNGFASEYTYGEPYSEQRNFKVSEERAIKEEKGLWRKCAKKVGN